MSSSLQPALQTPLSVLFHLYSPRFSLPISSINSIPIKKQIEILHNLQTWETTQNATNPLQTLEVFITEGMTELANDKDIAFQFYSILYQYQNDKSILSATGDLLKMHEWNSYELSRSLIAPITNLDLQFSQKSDCQHFYHFIHDFFIFIVNQRYSFKSLESEFTNKCDRNVSNFVDFIYTKLRTPETAKRDILCFLSTKWPPMRCLVNYQSLLNQQNCWKLLLRQKWGDAPKTCFAKDEFTKNVNRPKGNIYANLDIDYNKFRDSRSNTLHKIAFLMLWPNIRKHTPDAFTVDHLTSDGVVWYQESSPIENIAMAKGFKSIYNPYPNSNHGKNGCFVGLRRNKNNAQALCDGIYNAGWWWWCCGAVEPHQGGIPGPMLHSVGIVVQHMELYVFDINLAIHKYAAMLQALYEDEEGEQVTQYAFVLIAQFVYDYRNIVVQSMNLLHPPEDDYDSN